MDYIPEAVLRVMAINKWVAAAGESDVAKFLDTLMLENEALVLQWKAPADYRRDIRQDIGAAQHSRQQEINTSCRT
jgi:hypothetical protein